MDILDTIADLKIFPERSCKPLLKIAPPTSIEPANLSPPSLKVVAFEVDEQTRFPIVKASKVQAADITVYQACMEQDIRCMKGFLINSPHIVALDYPGTYYFQAYSCIWRDRAHQKTGSFSLTLEDISEHKLYCSRPSENVTFNLNRKTLDSSAILAKVKAYDQVRSKFHKSLLEFRDILQDYQEHAENPPLGLLNQILKVLYLRDNIHSVVGTDFFNHSIFLTYRLAHRYQHLADSLPISANMIRNCASNSVLTHMQSKPIPEDPYSYRGNEINELDSSMPASLSPLTAEKLSLMSEATVLAMLSAGGATTATKETFKTIQYQVLNHHFAKYSQTPEQSPIHFGVGVAFTTTTAMEIQKAKNNATAISVHRKEIELYERLNKWSEDFISLRYDYLSLKKQLHIDQIIIN